MTTWRDVRAAFDDLLGLPDEERQARLNELADTRPELAQELSELLEHDRAAASDGIFLERGIGAGEGGGVPDASGSGQRIGPYELLHELGRGGMGTVYLARRADGAFERRVALKLIQQGLGDERVLERFRRERQVLANLEHPGIARLIEGGATDDGAPYIVMEYVEGTPIDAYCDGDRLTIRARLELFLEVCEAVQHAHQNLVVHRDLKPGNVIVTAGGRAVLLDFGIAKVLDPEKSSSSPELTLGWMPFLTPAYASPEQVTGRPITVASDVYSLGVLLYELLTGRLPYTVATTSMKEVERTICEVEAGRPSAVVRGLPDGAAAEVARARSTTPRGLVRALSGDLDRVVAKALRKESRLRYPSVEQLARDLRRYLSGLPVTARPTTFLYRASKFVRRNRAALTGVGSVVLALAAGLWFSVGQYRRAEAARIEAQGQERLAVQRLAESERLADELSEERRAAQERVVEVEGLNRELAEQRELSERRFAEVRAFATDLIFQVHRAIYPLPGSVKAQELVVSMGLEHLDRLAADAGGDRELQKELAKAYLRIASIQGNFIEANLGRTEEALTGGFKAVQLAEAAFDAQPDARDARLLLAQALGVRATLLRGVGRGEEALDGLRRAAEVCDPIAADPVAQTFELNIVCAVQGALAETLMDRGSIDEANALFRRCAPLLTALADRHGLPQHEAELQLVRAGIARSDYELGRWAEGLDLFESALDELTAVAEAHPTEPNIARRLSTARSWGAWMLLEEGDLERAAALIEADLEQCRAMMALDPAEYRCRQDFVFEARSLIELRNRLGQPEAAIELAEDALTVARELVRDNPADVFTRTLQGGVLSRRGTAHRLVEEHFEAGQSLTEAREILERVCDERPGMFEARSELVRVFNELGRAQRASGGDDARSLAQAIEWFDRSLAEIERAVAAGIPERRLRGEAVRRERAECQQLLAKPAD